MKRDRSIDRFFLYLGTMKLRTVILTLAALALCLSASAQTLKPVKDKSTKKFGYQAKDKSWVIQPAYDRAQKFTDGRAVVTVDGLEGIIDEAGAWILPPQYNNIGKFDKMGLCEVTVKEGRSKYYGVVNTAGKIILPPDCTSLSYSRTEGLVMARRATPDSPDPLWGVYDLDGRELFEPQFSSAPSFSRGAGVARSAYTGLEGLISPEGEVLLPFENLASSEHSSTRDVLKTDFNIESYDQNMVKIGQFRSPGSIIPYEIAEDDVRMAAWHVGCIGRRLHQNNVYAANVSKDALGRIAICNDLGLKWGYGRFIRLEPELDSGSHPGSMEHPVTGEMYTLRALMYEADGSFVGVVSDWGWLEAEFAGGCIYNAEGEDQWLILEGANAPMGKPGSTVRLPGWHSVDHGDVISGLLLSSSDLNRLSNPSNRVRRIREIIEGENVGINSYLPRPKIDRRMERYLNQAMQNPIFARPYGMYDVVNCKLSKSGEDMVVDLADGLVCHFEDKFDNPSYHMEGEEEIFWGPFGRRFVQLSLEPAEKGQPAMADDTREDGIPLKCVITLHEADGSYIRTLGEAPCPDFIEEDVIIFEGLGIALINTPPGRRSHDRDYSRKDRFRIPAAKRLAPVLSAINGNGPAPEPGQEPKPEPKPEPRPGTGADHVRRTR